MSAAEKKDRVEFICYCVISVFMLVGFALVLTALLLPYWYSTEYTVGIVKVEADFGLYQDRICIAGKECDNVWLSDDDYDRVDYPKMPDFEAIKGLELAGVINAGMGLLNLLSLWGNRKQKLLWKYMAQGFFFFHSLLGGFLCVTGTLLLSSGADTDDMGYAPIVCGAGCAFLFISACLSCLVCRYDASYGTLENPVSSAYRNA